MTYQTTAAERKLAAIAPVPLRIISFCYRLIVISKVLLCCASLSTSLNFVCVRARVALTLNGFRVLINCAIVGENACLPQPRTNESRLNSDRNNYECKA